MAINNTPNIGPYTELKPFRFWCQKVLPLVYDESLSYYELLCKVVDYLNKTMEDVDQVIADMVDFQEAYRDFIAAVNEQIETLETFVNNYFENLNVQTEINNKLDAMAEAGYFDTLFTTLFTDDIITEAGNVTSAWIAANLSQETGYVIDKSLTVENAAADAKATGDIIQADESAYAIGSKMILYNTLDRSAYTYRTMTFDSIRNRIYINGTADTALRVRISETLNARASTTYPAEWTKTLPLLNNHYYKISKKVVSGLLTVVGRFTIVCVNENNTNQVILEDTGDSQTFKFTGNTGLLYILIGSGCVCNDLVLDIVLEDVTEEVQTEENKTQIDAINTKLYGGSINRDFPLTAGTIYTSNNIVVGEPLGGGSSNANGHTGIFDIEPASGGYVDLFISELTTNATTVFGFADKDGIVLARRVTSNYLIYNEDNNNYELLKHSVPNGTKYLFFSGYKSSDDLTGVLYPVVITNVNEIQYVSPNGNDVNSGLNLTTAKQTINAALQTGAKIILLDGGVYSQKIDLSYARDNLTIAPADATKLPVFYGPDSLIADSETLETGYTKVYKANCTKVFSDTNIWIFQDNVNDANTVITDTDRHPLQRGKYARCEDTRIVKCNATNKNEALTEIENASVYKWFIDTDNNLIYFSRPQSVNSTHPIRGSFNTFNTTKRNMLFKISGVKIKYMKLDIREMIAPELTDCTVLNVHGAGGILWDQACGAIIRRCEVANVFSGANAGDGLNAHSLNNNDAFAKQTTSFLFDCWAHDNCDDGYSDHERCETSIYGGLFENNGGAGVTPAVGSHCTCYNVLSRYNSEADFFYTGDPSGSEGGVGGQLICYNCVAKGNGQGRGFRLNGATINGLFVNCIAINRQYGYYSEAGAGTQVGTLINCSTSNCTTPASSQYTVINGTPVE